MVYAFNLEIIRISEKQHLNVHDKRLLPWNNETGYKELGLDVKNWLWINHLKINEDYYNCIVIQ